MEGEEEIGGLAVLARASDLRSRVSACAAAAAARREPEEAAVKDEEEEEDNDDEEVEEEEEPKSLVGISDALESLERQLAALQDLQHQQRYERETMLTHIDRTRRLLLHKLKEHKGRRRDDREVIREVAAFAGGKMDHHHDDEDGRVLPPYSTSLVTSSFVLDDLYPLNVPSKSTKKTVPESQEDGTGTNGFGKRGATTTDHGSQQGGGGGGGIGSFVGWLARTAVMVAGAVTIVVKAVAAAGYDPAGGTIVRTNNVNKLDVVGATTTVCPPGKVMVVYEGEEDGGRGGARCVVKERVVVPFVADLGSPSASYGLG